MRSGLPLARTLLGFRPVNVVLRFVLLGVLALAGCGKPALEDSTATQTPEPEDPRAIKIGLIVPLSGEKAAFGEAVANGAGLAIEQIQAEGGVLGAPVKLVVRDTRSEPGAAAAAVRELADTGVVAVIGEVTSERTLEAATVAAELGLPLISPGATHADVTKAGPSIFRVCYADPFPGIVMSKFASSIGAGRAAVLYDPENPYSRALAEIFANDFIERGGEVVARETFATGALDFTQQLAVIKKQQPEIIFLPSYFVEAASIIRQARREGIDATFLGTDGWESPQFLEAGGTDVNNTYFASHFSVDADSARTREFVTAYQGKFGRPPEALAALGYDAVRFTVDGIRRAGKTDRTDLVAALAATTEFPGVTGDIRLDAERNPAKSAIVIRVEEGKFTYLETVMP